jgi:hypothetical protein
MVQGNWERRAELSLLRRTAAKEKKALKNDTTRINPEGVLQKLQRDEQLAISGARITVYLTDQTEKSMCKCQMRTEDCRLKKCKLPHNGVTVAHLKKVVFTGSTSGIEGLQETEKACLPPIPLDEVPFKESSRTMFIAIDKECIFDYLHPEVWHEWVAVNRPAFAAKDKKEKKENDINKKEPSDSDLHPALSSVKEERGKESASDDDDDDHSDDDSHEGEEKEKYATTGITSSSSKVAIKCVAAKGVTTKFFSAEGGEGRGTGNIFSYLSDEDLVAFLLCSKMSKGCCLRDESVRGRKKEAIAAYSHNASKKKKQEKRKKAKNACISKEDKKDGFARGATIR